VTDRKIVGVAGGLGAYFSIDPVLFRIGFVVGTLFSGAGLVAYVALLLFVRSEPTVVAPVAAQPQPA
jgi:phage shock protein PspC (stress-responsive transcriptional regulator)